MPNSDKNEAKMADRVISTPTDGADGVVADDGESGGGEVVGQGVGHDAGLAKRRDDFQHFRARRLFDTGFAIWPTWDEGRRAICPRPPFALKLRVTASPPANSGPRTSCAAMKMP